MSSSAAASTEEFIELLSAEQYVDLQKLRDYARHGIQPGVRGEVWLYLLGVLSDDKSQEMTSVRSKYMEYDSLDKQSALYEKRIRSEAARYYQRRLIPRPPPGRKFGRPFHRISLRGGTHPASAQQDKSTSVNPSKDTQGSRSALAGEASALEPGTTSRAGTRGPNRVDNGQQRVLAGIMGGSVSFAVSSNSGQDSQRNVLLDPEAASANEMKRFCLAMEDIVCAHLNRWKWRTAKGESVLLPSSQQQERHVPEKSSRSSNSSSSSSSSTSGGGTEAAHPQNAANGASKANLSLSDVSVESSIGSVVSSQRLQTDAVDAPMTEPGTAANVAQSLMALPKEYEWAHQPADLARGISPAAFAPLPMRGPKGAMDTAKRKQRQLYRPEYHPDLIILCAPFVMCIRSEAGMYFAFERLMSLVGQYDAQHPLPARISTFLTLFRTTLPDLYAYFDEEEVDVIGLASSWLRHLLAAEMRIEDVMRLWDTYFAVPDPLDLHMYVCLAILTNCKDALEELDQSEAKSMLFSLPPLDVDRIINEAINIRLAHRQSEILTTISAADDDDDEISGGSSDGDVTEADDNDGEKDHGRDSINQKSLVRDSDGIEADSRDAADNDS